MNKNIFRQALICAAALSVSSCKDNASGNGGPAVTDTLATTTVPALKPVKPKAIAIAVAQSGSGTSITVNDKTIAPEELAAILTPLLLQQEKLPVSLNVEYADGILMGTRGAVESEIATAIRQATNIKYKAYIKTLEPSLTAELKTPATLTIELLRKEGNMVFLAGTLANPSGGGLDLSKTAHAQEAEAGVYSTSVFALVNDGTPSWKIMALSIGATDMPIVCWWKDFNVPKTLFPEGMAANECQ